MSERKRAHYIPALQYIALSMAVEPVETGLDTLGTFLVGSCLERPDFRDVDVRTIMRDETYDQLFPVRADTAPADAFWSLLCASIGAHLERASQLPIDYQIQRCSEANALHPGPRNALIASSAYPGELPSHVRVRPGPHNSPEDAFRIELHRLRHG